MSISYVSIYNYVRKQLLDNAYESVLSFNGRHINNAAVRDAANSLNIKVFYHERTWSQDRYWFNDERTHCVSSYQKSLQDTWSNKGCSDLEAYNSAAKYLETQDNELHTTSNYYPNWSSRNSQKLRVAYLASSLDEQEYFLAEPHLCPGSMWKDQRTAVIDLIHWLNQCEVPLELIVRPHPYEKQKSGMGAVLWDVIRSHGKATVLQADSVYSSRDIAKEADIIILYHSSMGPELMAEGKKVYTMNGCSYDYLDSVNLIESPEYIKAMAKKEYEILFDKPFLNKRKELIKSEGLMHIFCLLNLGLKYNYYEPLGVNRGRFMGLEL